MLLSTTDNPQGGKILKTLGVVRGSTIRARHFGRDIMAFFRMLAGGEIKSYTAMMAEAREEAIERMISAAEQLGANAVIGMKLTSVMVMSGSAECLAYGTAVKIEGVEEA
ncbi:MAG: YbjQ family protein [Fibrobacterota bacterium]